MRAIGNYLESRADTYFSCRIPLHQHHANGWACHWPRERLSRHPPLRFLDRSQRFFQELPGGILAADGGETVLRVSSRQFAASGQEEKEEI